MTARVGPVVGVAALALSALLAGCDESRQTPNATGGHVPPGVITLGDVDPDEPATRVRRIQPLADYLGKSLADFAIGRGRVLVARDIQEMSQLMADGKVDFYLDSPFPVLTVNRRAGSENLLLRHAKDDAEYWTVFIARKDGDIRSLYDLRNNVTVFQEPHSTSGFLLPASLLLDLDFTMRAVARPDSKVADGDVGCYFSGDEENTIELVRNGAAKVGVISNQDWRELPEQTRAGLTIVGKTDSVPRQLVSVRKGLDPGLTAAIRDALLALTDSDREELAAKDAPLGWTWRFADLTKQAKQTLTDLEAKMDRLPACIAAQ